jgi:hypothetical protein
MAQAVYEKTCELAQKYSLPIGNFIEEGAVFRFRFKHTDKPRRFYLFVHPTGKLDVMMSATAKAALEGATTLATFKKSDSTVDAVFSIIKKSIREYIASLGIQP